MKVFCFILFFFVSCQLLAIRSYAEESKTAITSDSLEYDKNKALYTARGSVKVEQNEATIEAAEMRYEENTSLVFAEGDVKYDDPSISLKAEKAKYNIETKTGTFYNAEIFSKRDGFHITGAEIEKKGEDEYLLKNASLTTCEGLPPDWCFKGSDVDVILGDRFKAKHVTFNVRKMPVFYTPYLWAPILIERKTGFLTPLFGYSKEKGVHYMQPFFWAIDENKDATLVFDWYGKKGIGQGLEYRYVGLGDVSGKHWFYHIYDNQLNKTFYELKSLHEKRSSEGLSGYLNLNMLSGKEFYREYSTERDERTKRFAESTAEISYNTDNSRLYIAGQYLTDLKEDIRNSTVLQKLPELGYVINPANIGPTVFSLSTSASNFWREKGVIGQRIDLYPKISHSFGDEIILSQRIGLRETFYSLNRNEEEGYKDSVNRETFDYNITAFSRILKNYGSFTHAVEPSLAYTYMPHLKQDKTDTPLFDSTELYSRTSIIELSVLNRFFNNKGEFFTLKISGAFDSYKGDTPFSSFNIAAAVSRPIKLKADASYNPYSGHIESANSEVKVDFNKIALSVGERYNRSNDTMFFDLGIHYAHSKSLSGEVKLWYDAKGGGMRDATLKVQYQKQCWGMTIGFNTKPADDALGRPRDYGVSVTFDLLGFGSVKG